MNYFNSMKKKKEILCKGIKKQNFFRKKSITLYNKDINLESKSEFETLNTILKNKKNFVF